MESWLEKRWVQGGMIFLLGIVFLWNLGGSSIWDSNEAFYVETPREMMKTGDMTIPYFNQEFRLNKPPLTYWLGVCAYRAGGVGIWQHRLLIALFTAGLLLVVGRLARQLGADRGTAWLAVWMTALTPRIFFMSRRALIEILLSFWIAAALYFFWRLWKEGKARDALFLYLSLALGFLTKGPVAVVLPGAMILAFLLWRRRLSFLAKMRLAWGIPLFLAVILPWFLALWYRLGLPVLVRFFLLENLGRYSDTSFGPDRGLFYYVPGFFANFFPWSLLFLCAVWDFCRRRKEADEGEREGAGLLLIWTLVPIVFFSLSKNKQEYYTMPGFPGGALLVAMAVRRALAGLRVERIWRVALVSAQILMALAAVAGAVLVGLVLGQWIPGAVLVAMVTGLSVFSWWKGSWRHRLVSLLAALWVTAVMAVGWVLPGVEAFRPVPKIAEVANRLVRPGERIGFFGFATPSLAYYSRFHILQPEKPAELRILFAQPQRFYCLLERQDLVELEKGHLPYRVVGEWPILETRFKPLLDSARTGHVRTVCLVVNN